MNSVIIRLLLATLLLLIFATAKTRGDDYDEKVKDYQQQMIDLTKDGKIDDVILVAQKLSSMEKKHAAETAKNGPDRIDGKQPTQEKSAASDVKSFADFFQNLTNHDLTLKRTSSTSGTSDPATFSYLQDFHNHTKSGFTAAFDLEYTPLFNPGATDTWVYNHTSAEGLISSVPKTQNTKWDLSQGIDLYTQGNKSDSVATYTTILFKDESDQDFTLNRLSGDIVTTPTPFTPEYGYIGAPFPIGSSPVYLVWRPYFGFNAGGVVTSSNLPNVDQNAPVRFSERTYAKVVMPIVAEALKLSDFYIFADDTICYLPTTGNARNYLTSGAVVSFTDNISLNLTYSLGQQAPVFGSAETLQASLGIKF